MDTKHGQSAPITRRDFLVTSPASAGCWRLPASLRRSSAMLSPLSTPRPRRACGWRPRASAVEGEDIWVEGWSPA